MAVSPRFHGRRDGTRFKVFAQSSRLGFDAETLVVDVAPGVMGAGPSHLDAPDWPLVVIDAVDKPSYFSDRTGRLRTRPAYPFPSDGEVARVKATPVGGHFDHLKPGRRAFSAAAAFAAIRRTLEVWRHHLRHPLRWHFADDRDPTPVLQVHPRVETKNAWSGPGFLEFGFPGWDALDEDHPFAENFEVVAHETGHLIMKTVVGTMPDDEKSLQFRAHEEAAADLIALVTLLHFDSVVEFVLEQTHGHLFTDNALARVGEWGVGAADVARTAFNDATLGSARQQRALNKHQLSSPFAGAVYDILVEIFQRHLVRAKLLPEALAEAARHRPLEPVADLKPHFTPNYQAHREDFGEALREACDDLARLLAGAWRRTDARGLTYAVVVANLIDADKELGTGYGGLITHTFASRGIRVGHPCAPRW